MEATTTLKSRVKFSDMDISGRYKISAAMRISAEIAGYAYKVKGLGYEFLHDRDMVFLVSQISLKIIASPQNEQIICTRTWENGKKGVLFLRGFEICSEDNQLLIQGVSGWALMRPSDGKIMRPADFPYPFPQLQCEFECPPLGKIPQTEMELIGKREVRYSDIDPNKHINNAVYADIIQDFLPPYSDIETIKINFGRGAVLGDTIDIYSHNDGEKYFICGRVDGKNNFDSEIILKEN